LTGPVPSMVPNGSAALYLAVADGAGVALAAVSANALAQTPPNNPAPAIWAFGEDDSGVKGVSLRSDGVVGESASPDHAGVIGRNSINFTLDDNAVGVYGTGGKHAGKFDGHVQVNGGATITGTLEVPQINTVNDRMQIAGACTFTGPGIAGIVEPTVTITGGVLCNDTIQANDVLLAGADFAEEFDILDADDAEPGTVMVLDREGVIKPSCSPYDRKVAGIISGAGDYRPGIVLDKRAPGRRPRSALALVGKVYCKVDANYASIETGDMLTTSPTHGHAMKASDPVKSFGAVIGKALRPLTQGAGVIPVLVALQ